MQKRLYAASVDARRRGPAVRAWHLAVLALGVVVAVLHSLRSTRSTPLGGLRAKRAPASAADYAIPALIWQTWFTSDLFPAAAARVAQTKRLNPGHAHRLVNDTEAAAFMRRHFAGRVANAYFAINPVLGAARADLWRYCVLYKFGGFYLDLDVKCDRPLRALHSPGAKLVHTHEHTPLPAKPPKALDCIAAAVRPGRASQLFSPRRVAALGLPQTTVAQYFLGAAPKDPVLKLVIDDVVRSIEALDEGRCGTPKTFSVSAGLRAGETHGSVADRTTPSEQGK
ncbi:nucleotide-diphospho-sugar transferase [Pelagophyceae sp. CCMP2097]|nr:nucleotide-diphospho-sugar transferase [Pelagophyceae sp. CCMP2097]